MMARSKNRSGASDDGVISLVAPDMRVSGDLTTDGSVRIEGEVKGNVRAEKAVVVGKDGDVEGDIHTQDAIVSGRINGSLTAASRLEVQATARVEGDIHARRIQLEEGALLNGTVQMSDDVSLTPGSRPKKEGDPKSSPEQPSAPPSPEEP